MLKGNIMKTIKEYIQEIKTNDNIKTKTAIAFSLEKQLEISKSKVKSEDKKYLYDFSFNEALSLKQPIIDAKDYKKRDEIFAYLEKLLSFIMYTQCLSQQDYYVLLDVVSVVEKYRVLENLVDLYFMKDKIGVEDIKKIIETASDAEGSFEKGKLFVALMRYEKKFDSIENDARELLVKYLNKETLELVLGFDKLDEDSKFNLEILCDLLRLYFNKDTVRILKIAEQIKDATICFYASDSLMSLDYTPSQETVNFLANDKSFACRIYESLKRNGLLDMYPKEFAGEDYLSKSSMIHWLSHTVELGEMPEEIECVGNIKKRKTNYYVFKFKTKSNNLQVEKRNVWLVGVASVDNKTFSEFDRLSDFEKETVEKTLKSIAKKYGL